MKKHFLQFIRYFSSKIDILFFYLFLSSCTFSTRKVISFFPLNNSFNEYTGIYIYLSDIFLIMTLGTWLIIIIYNNYYSLSSYIQDFAYRLRKCFMWNNADSNASFEYICSIRIIVSRGTFILKKNYQQVIHNYLVIFPLFAGFFSLLSNLWVTNLQIGLFRALKIWEFVLLFYYIIFRIVPCETTEQLNQLFHVKQINHDSSAEDKLRCSTWNILKHSFIIFITLGIIQAIIAILQFLHQKSIGLLWLKESIIAITIPGVAKVILNGETYIRAYGLMPHPNVLGGYLVFSIIFTLLYLKLFHVKQMMKDRSFKRLINFNSIVSHGTIMALLGIQGLALLLTFSKSAIFGLIIALFYIFLRNVPRETSKIRNFKLSYFNKTIKGNPTTPELFHVKQMKIILIMIVILGFILYVAHPDFYALFIKSLQERMFYLNVSRETFLNHPVLGLGSGQSVLLMLEIPNIKNWQFQPVHNVFLLVLNEFGILFLIGFVYFIYKLFHMEHRELKRNNGATYLVSDARKANWIIMKPTNSSTWNNDETLTNNNIYVVNTIKTYLKALLLAFMFIMLFDHYLWDIQQGQIILWLLAGYVAAM